MKKKRFAGLFTLILCGILAFSALAAGSPLRLVDEAGLLSGTEENALLQKLDGISQTQGMDVVIVTVNSTGGKSAMEYADDYYDYNGYAQDGILLLIDMGERNWWISTAGYGITAFTDAGQEYLSAKFLSDLSNGDYAKAFTTFAEQCDDFITQAKTGKPYTSGNLPKEPFDVLRSLVIALAVGFGISFLITGSMKSQLKTVRSQAQASNYVVPGSIKITGSHEMFLYKNISRTERQDKSSSTHTSSSGTSHGGSGGKF